MKLKRVRIKGFQSFEDSGDMNFEPGINLIIGQNNSGKSAFFRALKHDFLDDRHKNEDKFELHLLAEPAIELSVVIPGDELKNAILKFGQRIYFSKRLEELEKLFSKDLNQIDLTRHSKHNDFSSVLSNKEAFNGGHSHSFCVGQLANGILNLTYCDYQEASLYRHTYSDAMKTFWQEELFFFDAERLKIGQSLHGVQERLEPDASNLPTVLNTLLTNDRVKFDKLVSYLKEVFSTIGNITVPPSEPNQVEIRVFATEDMSNRALSFSLLQSGTGVAQALAILTAIMTLDTAIIMIDEINSFLHPAAMKALLRIIQTEYAHHQYIISTHALDVISYSNPSTVHLIRKTGYKSIAEKIDLNTIEDLRNVASHLGVSMSDVFAADKVVWVEGQTEELCFPYLYQEFFDKSLPKGMLIVAVKNTGDFNRNRDRKLVYEIYKQLSSASSSLTETVAFSFDSELLSDAEKEKMKSESKSLIQFLPRRHFECYLINSEAINAFICSKNFDLTVTPTDVEKKLKELGKTFGKNWNEIIEDENWLCVVDAANLIDAVCSALSGEKVRFNKKNDSLFLLKHILKNKKESLQELADYVHGLVEKKT